MCKKKKFNYVAIRNALLFLISFVVINTAKAGDIALQAGLIKGSIGLSPFTSGNHHAVVHQVSILTIGVGTKHIIVGTKLLEWFGPSPASSGHETDNSWLPIYLYVTSGIPRRIGKPVFYFFFGITAVGPIVPSDNDVSSITNIGIGVKTTLLMWSFHLEGSWRHSIVEQNESYNVLSFCIGAELGGWWNF